MKRLAQYIAELLEKKNVVIPEKWVKFFKLIFKQDAPMLKMKDLIGLYMTLYPPTARIFESQKEKIVSKCQAAILYYRDAGLFLYYESVPLLSEYVFHKPMFHHDLSSVLSYEDIHILQKTFDRKELNTVLHQYRQDDILSGKLLDSLWHQYNLLDQKEVLIQLLQAFSLCYSVSNHLEVYYCPWFVENNLPPHEAKPENLHVFEKKHDVCTPGVLLFREYS